MEVYIDKEFVFNYWDVDSKNDPTFKSFRDDFLKFSDRYTLITNFLDFNEIEASDEASLFFLDVLNDSKVSDIVFFPELLDDENLNACINNGGCKLFFIEFKDSKCLELENKNGYEFISSNELKIKWESNLDFYNVERTIALPINHSDSEIFNTWKDLSFMSNFPTNSIVISDKYILSDKSQGKLKYNIIPLLEQLIPKNYTGDLSIVLISEKLLENERVRSEKERAIKIHQLLKTEFAKFTHLKIKFSIVKFDKYFNSGEQPKIHDRHIYTNYFTIKCGSGFDLFDKDKRKIEDSEVQIRFNFHPMSMKTLPAKLDGLKKYFVNLETKEKLGAFKMWPENFEKFNCPILS